MSTPLPSDHEVREKVATDLDRSYVVEAGAGTGKTTLIVRRILSHVRRGDPLSGLIATTFTEKAASELKERVRSELDKALAKESDDTIRVRWLAARQFVDAAAIQTIHGFCTTLLRERPVEAGLDPGFDVLDGERAADLEREVFEATLEEIDPEAPLGTALARVLAAGGRIEALRSLCNQRIRDRDLACPDVEAGLFGAAEPKVAGTRAAGEVEFASPPCPSGESALREAATTLEELASECAVSASDPADRLVVKVLELRDRVRDFARLDAVTRDLELARFPRVATSRLGTKPKWKSPAALDAVRGGLESVFDRLETFQAELRHWRAGVMLAVAERCVVRYVAAKRAAGVIDFHDQLVLTRNLLRDRVDVRRALAAERISLIVDEFQDTDPLQAEIAFFLAEDPASEPATNWLDVRIGAGRLVLVGDPKQSIYRFRRADIEVYEIAKQRVTSCGGAVERIVVNFRCAPGVIDFVNQRFSTLIRKRGADDRTQPDYVELQKPPTPHGDVAAVAVLAKPEGLELQKVEQVRVEEARAIAGYVDRLVRSERFQVVDRDSKQKRAVTFRDCAILFRTLESLDAYEEALKGLDIPYRVVGGRRYFSRAEVKASIALFRALDDATDEVALLAVLRGPLFTISDADLLRFAAAGGELSEFAASIDRAPPQLRAALERIATLRGLRRDLTPSAFVEEAYAATRAIEVFSFLPEGPQRVANLEKLLTLSRSLEADRGATFRGFVEVASRMADAGERQAEAEYLDDDEPAVALLTMHAAKGLEWPVVVLADSGYVPQARTQFVLERGTQTHFEFGFGDKKARTIATHGFEKALEREVWRATAERRRLFYVAATRARDRLVISNFEKATKTVRTGDEAKSFADDLREDPAYQGQATDCSIVVDVTTLRSPIESEEPLRLKLDLEGEPPAASAAVIATRTRFAEHKRAQWETVSLELRRERPEAAFTAMGEAPYKEALYKEAPSKSAGTSRGTQFGTLVHRVLERTDLGAATPPDRNRIAAVALDLGATDSEIDATAQLLAANWSSPFFGELRGARRRLAELPFAFLEGAKVEEGAIDLVAEFADGSLWIVDWKTDDVQADAVAARFEQYLGQASRYRRAVESALGRPVARVCFHFLRPGVTREAT